MSERELELKYLPKERTEGDDKTSFYSRTFVTATLTMIMDLRVAKCVVVSCVYVRDHSVMK